jgi:hypothetical protein
MALFVDEGLEYRAPGSIVTDKETFHWWFEGLNVVTDVAYQDCRLDGEKVTCTLVSRGPCSEAQGLDVVHMPFTFTFRGDKIRSMVGDYLPEESVIVLAGAERIDTWAAAHRPEEFAKASNPAASGLSGREWGELYAGLCRDYMEASGG